MSPAARSTTRASRCAVAGLAVLAATSLAACSKDDGDSAPAADSSGSSAAPGAPAPQSGPPSTPIGQLMLTGPEAPGGGVVVPLPAEATKPMVDKLVEDQKQPHMQDPACDRISRLETVTNRVSTDGAAEMVRYQQTAEDSTEHRFMIGMAPGRMNDFMDRSLYEACKESVSTRDPQTTLKVAVADAPPVEGGEGFRVTSDFVTTKPEGGATITRIVGMHSLAHGVTMTVEYVAKGEDAAANPVLPTAEDTLTSIYTAQMNKLVHAQ